MLTSLRGTRLVGRSKREREREKVRERGGPKRVVKDGRGMLFRAWDQNPFIHFDLDMSARINSGSAGIG